MGGRLVKRHWSHRLFKVARRAGGFHFEIQMLLTAELVGTAYYEMIDRGVKDGPLNAALGLMLRDEASHVAFHLDRQKLRWSEWLPLERTAWELQFQVLVLAALRAAWLDHGRCLRSLGFTWDGFRQRGRQLAINFLDNLRSARLPGRQARPPLGHDRRADAGSIFSGAASEIGPGLTAVSETGGWAISSTSSAQDAALGGPHDVSGDCRRA